MKIGLENIESKTGKYLPTDSQFEGDGIAFYPNDVVYGKLRPYLQKVWLADFEGNAVGDFFVFKNKQNCNAKYLFYLMLSDGFTSECNGATLGAKMPRVSSEFIQGLRFFLPPTKEQKAIADYLDEKTSQIDSIIRAREKKIQLLEELKASIISNAVTHGVSNSRETKDSGNEWIGMIPSHWDVVQIRRVAKVILGKMLSTEKKETFEYLCAKDVHYGTIDISDLKRMFFSKDERELYEVKYGDMLIVEGGAGAGGCAVYKYNKQNVYIQNSIMIIRGKEQILSDYLCSFMQTINQRGYVKYICNTATIPHFSKEKVCSVVIPLPPISEQKQIIDHIIRRTSVINSSIINAEKEIELLREYRASLITEVVTGKRKVI